MDKKCRVCGSEDTELMEGPELFEYKGHSIEIPNYKKLHCRTCGESVADPEAVKSSVALLRDAQRSIDGFLTAREIRDIRKSFGLTQEQMSTMLGGGEKAFARYETGKVLQSKSMDNLLRVLREYPETIDVLSVKEENTICYTQKLNYKPHKREKPFEYVIEKNTFFRVAL